jgi:dolichyl-phosphate beta-glucosyltransferase
MAFLSVVIPAYNEADRITKTLERVIDYLRKQTYDWELLIVDDGSRDQTSSVVEAYIQHEPSAQLIRYQPNAGKGKAVRTGIQASSGDFVLFMDADESTQITELEKGLPWILEHEYDIAIGSRGIRESQISVSQPRYRIIGARIFKWVFLGLFGLRFIQDTQCGFKMFKGDKARWLFAQLRIDGYMFDIESLYVAHYMGFTIKEFPVEWENNPDSRLRIFYDTYRMFKHLAVIRLRRLNRLKKDATCP